MAETGEIITELRREAGYTQKSLAEALNITDKAVSKWERGICLPDVSLLPKLSLLLDADIELLLGKSVQHTNEGWAGLLDLRNTDFDSANILYDKPAVYFMLSHFMLLDIKEIYILGKEGNKAYLNSERFSKLGIRFIFPPESLPKKNLMIMDGPIFLFGSDLTRKFQGAMVNDAVTKLVPENQKAPFYFCPEEYGVIYERNPEYIRNMAISRTLGRGMICIELNKAENVFEAANFVRTYQKNTGLLIGSLEEIAYRKGIINREQLEKIVEKTEYGNILKEYL